VTFRTNDRESKSRNAYRSFSHHWGGQDTLFGGAGFDTLDGGYGYMSIDHCIDTKPGGATFIECEIQTATPTAPVGEAAVP
jgi:Ca2+-binding RTX toxin-like protein